LLHIGTSGCKVRVYDTVKWELERRRRRRKKRRGRRWKRRRKW